MVVSDSPTDWPNWLSAYQEINRRDKNNWVDKFDDFYIKQMNKNQGKKNIYI